MSIQVSAAMAKLQQDRLEEFKALQLDAELAAKLHSRAQRGRPSYVPDVVDLTQDSADDDAIMDTMEANIRRDVIDLTGDSDSDSESDYVPTSINAVPFPFDDVAALGLDWSLLGVVPPSAPMSPMTPISTL